MMIVGVLCPMSHAVCSIFGLLPFSNNSFTHLRRELDPKHPLITYPNPRCPKAYPLDTPLRSRRPAKMHFWFQDIGLARQEEEG